MNKCKSDFSLWSMLFSPNRLTLVKVTGNQRKLRNLSKRRRGVVSPLNLGNGVFQGGLGGIMLFLVCLKREESQTRTPSSSS